MPNTEAGQEQRINKGYLPRSASDWFHLHFSQSRVFLRAWVWDLINKEDLEGVDSWNLWSIGDILPPPPPLQECS